MGSTDDGVVEDESQAVDEPSDMNESVEPSGQQLLITSGSEGVKPADSGDGTHNTEPSLRPQIGRLVKSVGYQASPPNAMLNSSDDDSADGSFDPDVHEQSLESEKSDSDSEISSTTSSSSASSSSSSSSSSFSSSSSSSSSSSNVSDSASSSDLSISGDSSSESSSKSEEPEGEEEESVTLPKQSPPSRGSNSDVTPQDNQRVDHSQPDRGQQSDKQQGSDHGTEDVPANVPPGKGKTETQVRNKRRAVSKRKQRVVNMAREVRRLQESGSDATKEVKGVDGTYRLLASIWSQKLQSEPQLSRLIEYIAVGNVEPKIIEEFYCLTKRTESHDPFKDNLTQYMSGLPAISNLLNSQSLRNHDEEEAELDSGGPRQDAHTKKTVAKPDGPKVDYSSMTSILSQANAAKTVPDDQNGQESPPENSSDKAPDAGSGETRGNQGNRGRLDIDSSRRMIFGSLGVRNPKSKTQAERVREKLGGKIITNALRKDRAKREENQSSSAQQIGTLLDPNDWKSNIYMRVTESCNKGSRLSTPVFPFVQQWHKGAAESTGRKRKRGSGNKATPMVENQVQGTSRRNATSEDNIDQIDQTVSSNPDSESIVKRKRGSSWICSTDLQTEAPPLPDDLTQLPSLTIEQCKVGTMIVFQQLECSAMTNWAPQVSPIRTSTITDTSDEGDQFTLHLLLAERDAPTTKNRQYDAEGNRVYGRFECPDPSDDEEMADGGENEEDGRKLTVAFAELMNPRVLQSTPLDVN